MNISKNQKGFTLIELSVVMVIVGLLVAGFFAFLNTQQEKQQLEDLDLTFSNARQRLAEYITDIADQSDVFAADGVTIEQDFSHTRWSDDLTDFENDAVHYPCPAPLNAVPGDANFGVESRNQVTGQCQEIAGGVFRVTAPSGEDVFIGTLPTSTLELSSEDMADPFGFKLTYAVSDFVSRNEALSGAVDPVGAIQVNDNADPANPEIRTAEFMLISHGKDGKGAFPLNGTAVATACSGTNADTENCNYTTDAVFSIEQFSEAEGTSFFDDKAAFSLLNLENDQLWDETPTDSNNIYNLNTGNVGVGIDTPASKLDVDGEVRMGNSEKECTAANEGAVRYDASEKIMKFCNGVDFIPFGNGSNGADCPVEGMVHSEMKHGSVRNRGGFSCDGFIYCSFGTIVDNIRCTGVL